MLQTLARPAAAALPTRASRTASGPAPVLRLRQLPIDPVPTQGGRRLSLDAWPGELIHLGGGSAAQRLQVLRLAAGLAGPQVSLGQVLQDDPLPTGLSVPGFVAEPLRAAGLGAAQARTRADLELYLLGAAGLRQRPPQSLGLLEARQVRLARATVTRPALLVLAWPDRGLSPDAGRALRLVLTTLACTFGSCVLVTSDNPRLGASADRHIDLDRLG